MWKLESAAAHGIYICNRACPNKITKIITFVTLTFESWHRQFDQLGALTQTCTFQIWEQSIQYILSPTIYTETVSNEAA